MVPKPEHACSRGCLRSARNGRGFPVRSDSTLQLSTGYTGSISGLCVIGGENGKRAGVAAPLAFLGSARMKANLRFPLVSGIRQMSAFDPFLQLAPEWRLRAVADIKALSETSGAESIFRGSWIQSALRRCCALASLFGVFASTCEGAARLSAVS